MYNSLVIFGAKYLFLVAILIFVVYFIRLSKNKRRGFFTFSSVSLFTVYVTGLLAGYLYNNPRPFVSEHIIPLIPHSPNNGFPSDHTILVVALASILYCFNRTIGIAVFIIAFLIGTSRVFAGIHHWIDIVGSFGIAVTVIFVVCKLSRKYLFF
jgi:undecaprenyl-diphosphatase